MDGPSSTPHEGATGDSASAPASSPSRLSARGRRIWPDDPGPVRRAALIIICCYLTGLAVVNLGATPVGGRIIDHIFPRAGGSLDHASIDTAWNAIRDDYVIRDVPGSVGTLGSEQGMVAALKQQYGDRFTALFTAQESAQFNADLSGQRTGSIGITLEGRCPGEKICATGQNPTEIVIEEVLRDQPADKAGFRNGDVLVAVAGTPVTTLGTSVDDQITALTDRKLIRGDAGTSVSLTVRRGTTALTLSVTRQNLSIPSVYSERLGSVLYVQVTEFASDTGDDVKAQLQQRLGDAKAVILDLRHDGGGYVTAAQTTASQFLTPGGRVQDVVVRRGRMSDSTNPGSATNVEHDAVQPGGVAPSVKLVVLADSDTASAAEIVTAALRDYNRAVVVGEKTFGKGSVQLDHPLPDGNVLHLTVERWYGPNGESIDGQGITPDDTVALPDPDQRFVLDAQSVDAAQDPQLQKALQLAA